MPVLIHLLWIDVEIASGTLLSLSQNSRKTVSKNGATTAAKIAKAILIYNSLLLSLFSESLG